MRSMLRGLLLIVATIVGSPSNSYGGTKTGNGGDVLFCLADHAHFPADGYYAFDYIFGTLPAGAKFVNPVSDAESRRAIRDRLNFIGNYFGVSFDDFWGIRPAGVNPAHERTWRATAGSLMPIGAADGVEAWKVAYANANAPAVCKGNVVGGLDAFGFANQVARLMPVVRRVPLGNGLVYYFNSDIFGDARFSILQRSITYTHEWFWDVFTSDDPQQQEKFILAIADSNLFLNSDVENEIVRDEFGRVGLIDLTKPIATTGDNSDWYFLTYNPQMPADVFASSSTSDRDTEITMCGMEMRMDHLAPRGFRCISDASVMNMYCQVPTPSSIAPLMQNHQCVFSFTGPTTPPGIGDLHQEN